MKKKITVGAVSYFNAKPLIYGIVHSSLIDRIGLILDYPSRIARQLIDGEIDVGLVPVAIIPELSTPYLITNYCIGAVGPVASVSIFSDVPIGDVRTVLLDYQSRTSVALARILLKRFWKVEVVFEAAGPDYQSRIGGRTAGVVIGDRAFEQQCRSGYSYDLAEAWMAYSGLPFIFAAWISKGPLPDSFTGPFDEANAFGLRNLDKVLCDLDSPYYDLKTYFTQNISYCLNQQKLDGMRRFLREQADLELMSNYVR